MESIFGRGKGLTFRLLAITTLVIGGFASTTETTVDDRVLSALETASTLAPDDPAFEQTLEDARVGIDTTRAAVTGLITILFTLAAQLFGDRAYTKRIEERVNDIERNQ